jgi:hypothetical protein
MATTTTTRSTASPTREAAARVSPAGSVVFEYGGATALTVIGGNTGARYRFAYPGARVSVYPRDEASLTRVPSLTRWR